MTSSRDPNPTEARVIAVACLIAEVAFLAWGFRSEWAIAAPALLLVHLIGLLGFGLYWLVARSWKQRRRTTTQEELFVSSGLFAALVAVSVTYAAGEWMGLQSVFGSLTGGVVVGTTLVLARLAIWGPAPKEEPPRKHGE